LHNFSFAFCLIEQAVFYSANVINSVNKHSKRNLTSYSIKKVGDKQ